MGPVSAEIEIDVPRERAFALLTDLSARPSFTDHFLSGFRLTRIDPVGVGAGARFRVEAPLRSPWMDTTIVEQEEPFRIVERGLGGRVNRIPTQTVWEITPGAGSLSTVRVTFGTDPSHPVDRVLERLSMGAHWQRRGWKRALTRLRDLLESEQPASERIAVAGGNRYATGIP
ncbi:MAG TPA: SRPBCC family protein [Solirubrobacterales bacterium]|nr:SRPBCC family protein [Solirubrobacterales bacterium]